MAAASHWEVIHTVMGWTQSLEMEGASNTCVHPTCLHDSPVMGGHGYRVYLHSPSPPSFNPSPSFQAHWGFKLTSCLEVLQCRGMRQEAWCFKKDQMRNKTWLPTGKAWARHLAYLRAPWKSDLRCCLKRWKTYQETKRTLKDATEPKTSLVSSVSASRRWDGQVGCLIWSCPRSCPWIFECCYVPLPILSCWMFSSLY